MQLFTDRLWQAAAPTYRAILEHPFLTGLTDGTLPPGAFGYYLAQDAHYLRDYARALAMVAVRAGSHADTAMFARHAAETAAVELQLHESLLPEYGVDVAAVPPSPTTVGYTSYLLATAHGGSYAEAIGAVLPCYWIYQRVGEQLAQRGSPEPGYQRWIDSYASEAFASTVAEARDAADRAAASLPEAELARVVERYVTACRYEWLFWDAAWRREGWPA